MTCVTSLRMIVMISDNILTKSRCCRKYSNFVIWYFIFNNNIYINTWYIISFMLRCIKNKEIFLIWYENNFMCFIFDNIFCNVNCFLSSSNLKECVNKRKFSVNWQALAIHLNCLKVNCAQCYAWHVFVCCMSWMLNLSTYIYVCFI